MACGSTASARSTIEACSETAGGRDACCATSRAESESRARHTPPVSHAHVRRDRPARCRAVVVARRLFFREQGGDENWQAHSVDLATGAIRVLTPGPGVRSHVQEVSRHFPTELLIGHNERDKRVSDLYRVNVVTGASERIETNDGAFVWYYTDAQLRVRLAARYTDDASVEYLQRGPDGEWSLFTRIDMVDAMSTRPIAFSDDGAEVYWLDSRGRDSAAVVAQDLRSGARRVLAEDATADFTELALDPRTLRPFAARVTFTRRRWQVLDPAYAVDSDRL